MSAVVPVTIIGYIRVSTDEQSLSVEAQHQALARWCQTMRPSSSLSMRMSG